MVDRSIEDIIRQYIDVTREAGIDIRRVVLFGSYANGTAHEWSDIDLVVIAPQFDGSPEIHLIDKLWELRAETDSRIEPIACGEKEWETDDTRPILAIARREGIIIAA